MVLDPVGGISFDGELFGHSLKPFAAPIEAGEYQTVNLRIKTVDLRTIGESKILSDQSVETGIIFPGTI